MTRLTKQSDAVRPSAPDPVDAWLDVLVTMLSIPKPDRQRVRDELEDHLRSRIDDLLIHGLTEPQALQKAVAELGETADLARQLSHAHKPPRTRRYAMHTLLIALTGTVVALGVNQMRPASMASVPALVQHASVESVVSGEPIPVRDRSIGEVLQAFGSQSEIPVLIHWSLLQDIGFERDVPIQIDADPLPFATILQLLSERSEPGLGDSIAQLTTPDLIEIGLRSQFDQRTMERRVYNLTPIVLPDDLSISTRATQGRAGFQSWQGPEAVAAVLWTHVSPEDWVQQGGSLATHSVVGDTLIVTAPLRMHEDIGVLLEQLRNEREADLQHAMADATGRLRAMQSRITELDATAQSHTDRIAQLEGELSELGPFNGQERPTTERISKVRSELNDLEQQRKAIRIRQIALMTRADDLSLELDMMLPSARGSISNRTSVADAITALDAIRYFDASQKMHLIPVEPDGHLALADLLATQGLGEDASSSMRVHVSRNNEALTGDDGVPVRSVFLRGGPENIALEAGDRVQIVERRLPSDRMPSRPSR